MKRWLADYRIQSEVTLVSAEKKKLKYLHPEGLYEVHIADSNGKESDENLSVQIILSAPDIQTAQEQAHSYLRRFLHILGFITSTGFQISRKRCLIDWTPGILQREAFVYSKHMTEEPVEGLSSGLLDTAKMLHSWKTSPAIETSLRWYSAALNSKIMEDQFQLFWFAIELIAISTKESGLVADKCSRCGGELFCEKCQQLSKHRPFEKQAIESLLEKTGLARQLIDDLFYVRNNLMHGEPREKIEESIQSRDKDFAFHKIVDLAGRAAWTVILNAYIKPPGEHRPQFLQVSTYVDWKRSATAHVIIGVSGDQNDPQVEHLHLPEVSLNPSSKSDRANQ
jgi:hypothetical protein